MPNQPVTRVSGANITVAMVRICMVEFCLRSIWVWCSSRSCRLYSRSTSARSARWFAWAATWLKARASSRLITLFSLSAIRSAMTAICW